MITEKIFCKYCKKELMKEKDIANEFHHSCHLEFTKSPDFNNFNPKDLSIIQEIKNKFNLIIYSINMSENLSFYHLRRNSMKIQCL